MKFLFCIFLISCSFNTDFKPLSEVIKNSPENSYDFGKISSSDSAPIKVFKFIHNNDQNSKEIPVPSLTGDSSFSIVSHSGCAKPISDNSICQVRIQFNPQNKINGVYKAQLKLGESYQNKEELTVEIINSSSNPFVNYYNDKSLLLNTPVDLGVAVSGTNSFTFFIKNEGTVPMINSALFSNSADFSYINECLNKTLDPNTQCKIIINFDSLNKPSGQLFSTMISFAGKDLSIQIKSPEVIPSIDKIQLLEDATPLESIDLGILKKGDVITKVFSFKNINNQDSNKGSVILENTTDFTILNQCLDKILHPNEKCDFRIIFPSNNKLGVYSSKINFLNKEIPIKVEVIENPN